MAQNTSTIRISQDSRELLRELAKEMGVSMQMVLEEAIEQYQRSRLFEELDATCRELKQKGAWEEEQAERRLWDNTLLDGLEGS